VVALLSSSKALLGCALCLLALSGCATVQPQDKEHLAEPSMAFSSGGAANEHEQHVLDNREGASGGGTTRGGGCGCN
jgi:hypothetical protein